MLKPVVFQIHSSSSGMLGPVLLCRAQELEEGAVPSNPTEGCHLGCTLHLKAALLRGNRHLTYSREQGSFAAAKLFAKTRRNAIAFLLVPLEKSHQ